MTDADAKAAASALVVLRARVDRHFDAALERSPQAMQCRPGCDGCCHVRLTVFSVEAAPIAASLSALARRDPALRARVRAQADDPAHAHRCPMLVDGRCAIYEDRPLICRSHGLPVRVDRPDRASEIVGCSLNFRAAEPPAASVLRLEAINQPLSVMARMFESSAPRLGLDELARAPEG